MTQENKERNEMIRRDFSMGLRPGYIAMKYNISRQRVYKICEGVNIIPIVHTSDPAEMVADLGIKVVEKITEYDV